MIIFLILIILLSGTTTVFSDDNYLKSNEFQSKSYIDKIKQIEDTFKLSENSPLLLTSAEEYLSLVEINNDHKRKPFAYHRLGVGMWRLSYLDSSYNLFEKANKLAIEYKDTFVIIESGIYQGLIFDNDYLNQDSKKKYLKSLYYSRLTKRYHEMASCCWNLSIAHGFVKNYDSALYYSNDSFKYLKMMEDQTSKKAIFAYSLAYMSRGVYHIDQHEWDSSLKYTLEALDLSKKSKSEIIIPPIIINIINAYNKLGKYDSVINVGTREMPIFQKVDNFAYFADLYYDMSFAFANSNRMDSAYHYMMLYKDSNDSLVKNDARVSAVKNDYVNLKVENEIKRLNQSNIIYTSLTSFAVLLVITILIFSRYRIKSKINKQQEELNRTKDKLFSLISHDLRTPLHSLNDLIKLINQYFDKLDDTDKRRYINNLQESSVKVTQLLENLLYWSRMQLKGINAKPIDFQLNNLLIDEVDNQKDVYLKKEINVKVECNVDFEVFADIEMTRIILRNLLSNAIKFTPNNGLIKIFAEVIKDKLILKVQDNGIGIKDEDKVKLFDFTSNFTTSGTNNEKGTGLGLILVKELAEKNNIKLSFDSKIGVGTTFLLEFERA